MDLKATSIRYFETRRGVGYECKTNRSNVVIWNDGGGGGTYIAPHYNYTKEYEKINEEELEKIIDRYESI